MTLKEKIIKKLETVMDPELRQDVYSLKLIRSLETDEENGSVSLTFRPTVYQCPMGIQLSIMIKRALMEIGELKKIDMDVIDYEKKELANRYLESLDSEMNQSYEEAL